MDDERERDGSERPQPQMRTVVAKGRFLAEYAGSGNLSAAARAADVGRVTHYRWLQEDPKYATDFQDAEQTAVDALEAEARRRAMGYSHEDEDGKVHTVRGSDQLIMFLLKGLRPVKYRDNAKPDAEGTSTSGSVEFTWEEQREMRQAIVRAKAERVSG